MRVLIHGLFFFFVCSESFSQTLKPTTENALFYILVVDKNDNPIQEKIVIRSNKTKKEYIVTSNESGLAEILIPKADTYTINLELEPNYDQITFPNQSFHTINYKIFYDKARRIKLTYALLHIQLAKSNKVPISEEVKLVSVKTKKEYTIKTDLNGNADISVPYNDSYLVNFKSAPNFDLIEIPNTLNYEHDHSITYEGSFEGAIYPSLFKVLFTFKFIDLDSIPLQDEKFYLRSKKNGTIYSVTTGKDGTAHLLVPNGDSYNVSSEYFKNFAVSDVSDVSDVSAIHSLQQVNVILKFISSLEFLERKKKQDEILKEREAEWEKRKDEYEEYRKTIAASGSIPPMHFAPLTDSVFTTVLNRNKHWKNKLIILDVTGSMAPYTDQVQTWYKLNYAQKDPIQFVLFNDGNNKLDHLKIIGKTGGIYTCKYCDIKTFADTLSYSRIKGTGGDGPENDLEATISAINNCKNYTDIILVVDNYSAVKDIELLGQIRKPIKIVLCGASNGFVNVDYLEIAYHTKGSIHIIEEDILSIGNTIDGAKIKIGKHYYILTKGKFLHYKDEK